MKRFRSLRPALKWRPGGTIKRKDRLRAQLRCERIDDAARPAVERMGLAIGAFGRGAKCGPVSPTHEADKHERSDFAELTAIVGIRIERAAKGKPAYLDRLANGGRRHIFR